MPDDPRGLIPKVITHFRGISQYRNIAGVPMEWAQDLLNVIIGGAGFIEKFRVPRSRTALQTFGGGPQNVIDTLYDFQQANGTRQLIANFLQGLGYYYDNPDPLDDNALLFQLIEASVADSPRFSYVDSNNLLFMANGLRALKWNGAQLQKWGIARPPAAPQMGVTVPILNIKRLANVITVVLDTSTLAAGGNFDPLQLTGIGNEVGDTVKVLNEVTDPTVNGSFAITGAGGAFGFTYASVGANFGPVAGTGQAIIAGVRLHNTPSADFTVQFVSRLNGTVTLQFTNNVRINVGENITGTGFTGASLPLPQLDDTFIVTAADAASVSFFADGPDIPVTAFAPAKPVVVGGFTDVLSPRTWRYTYGNSVTGHESAASDASTFLPNATNGLVANEKAFVQARPPQDPQVDTIFWYANLDSGQDWFLVTRVPIATGGIVLGDGFDDNLLDVTARANFINFPPNPCNLLSKWQSRVYFVENNDPQVLVYTGYEKILRGRPEESVPPGNRIRLQTGAQPIKGHGALMNGVVIWDNNDKMFMFKGTVEDIVTDQPVSYSEQLEEMPWMVGVYSHESICPTPYGLVWFGSDKAFHKWNGIFYGEIIGPTDISENIFPLLQRITKGTEQKVQCRYFNFLDRDWICALIAVDNSATPNRILFFDMSKAAEDNLGTFICDQQADAISVRVNGDGSRSLLIAVRGIIYEIKTDTQAVGGVHPDGDSLWAPDVDEGEGAVHPQLNAFWVSGYDGNDSPLMMKMYRFGRLIVDQDGFNVLATLVDDTSSTLAHPTDIRNLGPISEKLNKFSINWKARRCSITIQFPSLDCDASVLQLALARIDLSAR